MSISYRPQEARYYDLINETLKLTPDELAKLQGHGFVVTDRLKFPQFKRGYAYIYWKDWPVLITTDSILHAIHQTYDHLFQQVELDILQPRLLEFLSAIYRQVDHKAHQIEDQRIADLLLDLKTYLAVPLLVFDVIKNEEITEVAKNASDAIRLVNNLNVLHGLDISEDEVHDLDMMGLGRWHELKPLSEPQTVSLFGMKRDIDFAAFQARGHYDEGWILPRYFGVMMWLALLDFCFVSFDDLGHAQLHVEQIAAAKLLDEAITAAGQRKAWDEIDRLLTAFIGWSDNVTLRGLERFWEDAGITGASDCFKLNPEGIQHLLLTNDYGQQRIAAQGVKSASPAEIPNPISFMLMGQRFTVESQIMNDVIFDHLTVNGQKVPRPFPSPLDVMYGLGNDRAAEHLESEFERYRYRAVLDNLRETMSTYSHEFWESSFYNLWLKMIVALNRPPVGDNVPSAMKSEAWLDKMLHTELGGWTQLRHDHILYVKPPRPIMCVCDYPTGYVEPYPAFYQAAAEFARYGKTVFADLHTAGFATKQLDFYRTVRDYFELLEDTAEKLKVLANKELRGEQFSADEELFVKSVVVRKYVGVEGYGGFVEESWDGWYNDLLPFGDQRVAIVTDLHLNAEPALGPTGVLHVGTGDPAVILMLAGDGKDQTLYVGPAFTYYECLEPGYKRLSDWEWEERFREPSYSRLAWLKEESEKESYNKRQVAFFKEEMDKVMAELNATRPTPPAWSSGFRISTRTNISLELPKGSN